MTRIGQNTVTLNASKKVQIIPITVLFVIEYQNLNSGSRRINGRNSSLDRVGNSGPMSSVRENLIIIFSINFKLLNTLTISIKILIYKLKFTTIFEKF